MSGEPERLEIIRQWIEMAKHDLLNIDNNLAAQQIPGDTVCFHAQQCAEKYLKALLISKGVEVPRTHDLRLLLQRIPSGVSLGVDIAKTLQLNRYTIEARYPGDWEPITREEGERAVALARQVRDAVNRHLQ